MLQQISFYIHVLHLRLDICLFYMSTTQMFCEMCEKRLQLCERSSIATRILRYEPVLYNLTSFVLLGPFFVFFFAWLIRFSTFSNACSLAHSHARTLSLSWWHFACKLCSICILFAGTGMHMHVQTYVHG